MGFCKTGEQGVHDGQSIESKGESLTDLGNAKSVKSVNPRRSGAIGQQKTGTTPQPPRLD
jgi:hypothetical protein